MAEFLFSNKFIGYVLFSDLRESRMEMMPLAMYK